jgi:hypothetical protein
MSYISIATSKLGYMVIDFGSRSRLMPGSRQIVRGMTDVQVSVLNLCACVL